MSTRITRIFENDPLAAPVPSDLQAYVALTVKVTASPGEVTPEDVQAAYSAARSPREYYDAVGVMFAFNFITRVVNSLGVEPDIPWMRRFEPLRQLRVRAMGFFFRWFVDLKKKKVHGATPAEHLAALRTFFSDMELGEFPAWLERLAFAPPLLAAIREFLDALFRRDQGSGGLDVSQFMAIGQTVLRLTPNATTLAKLTDDWRPARGSEEDSQRSALITRFASDVASRSYTLTAERIAELRAANLDDAEILDIVVISALWSAAARLEVLTACLPAPDPRKEPIRQMTKLPHPAFAIQASS